MKKGLVCALGLFFVLTFFKPAFAADKLGYVDLAKIFDEYEKTKEYDKSLEAKAKDFEKEKDSKESELKQSEEKLNLLSDKEKEKKFKELDEKRKSSEESLVSKANELRQERNDRAKEILKDIDKVVQDYAKKEGYTMIFDVRSLVYNTKAGDVTEDILLVLQSSYKKGPGVSVKK